MKATIENRIYPQGTLKQFEIEINFSVERAGTGQWKLIAEVEFMNEKRKFHKRVFAEFIDDLDIFKINNPTSEEINEFCAKRFGDLNEREDIFDWCMEIEEEIDL